MIMDINFPHDRLRQEAQNDMVDLNAIRSSIIACASARQAGCETVKTLQKSNVNISHSKMADTISPLKSRILFFAKANKLHHDNFIQSAVKGPFLTNHSSMDKNNFNYESVVNLKSSNSVKSSSVEQELAIDILSHNNISQSNRG